MQYDTNGNIALAAFTICAVSGIILAIPFDVANAYDSIALLLITNPGAVFFRNLHYWSAQFFLAFTLLHLWDHLKLGSSAQQSRGVWFRLVLSILFTFFVMLSGFILKADADSSQARLILETLLLDIPIVGQLIKSLIFGATESLQLIYVHHIATATIFLIYIIYEHIKTLITKLQTFLITLAFLTFISFFIQAPFHDSIDPVIKGPWYFVGLQEILHWMSRPGWIWLMIVVLLILIYLTKKLNPKGQLISRRILWILGVFYLILTLIGFYFRGENWQWKVPWANENQQVLIPFDFGLQKGNSKYNNITANDIPIVRRKREACMVCHKDVTGFSISHNPEAIGCSSCHLGNPFTLDKDKAHQSMILIPGNLDYVAQTCGATDCHPDIPNRVNNSLMTTNSGIVSVDRWVFNEAESPDKFARMHDIGHSPADQHLRNLCAKCHLGNPKTESGPVDELSRGGGCTACHLNYSNEGEQQHLAYHENSKSEERLPKIHPSLDLNISNKHCFGCHSRSGRISTNYEGWHETLLNEDEIDGSDSFRVLQDKRVFEFVSEDVHHKAGLDCIDCHNSYETMGDGNIYMHEEEAVKIRCEDCHFSEKPKLTVYEELDTESKKIFDLRRFKQQDKLMIRGSESNVALINTYLENDTAFLIAKNKRTKHIMNPPASNCTREPHNNLTCSACHTAWAPQCIGCHNEFDKNAEGFDLLANRPVKGTWIEFVGKFLANEPTLGVWEGEQKQISPAIPGMVLSIDKSGYNNKEEELIFHRLFAPAAPHTTSTKGRSCKSCHNNPLAIGYGKGNMEYKVVNGMGIWNFEPAYAANKYDGLPEDAWIAFPAFSQEGSQQHMDSTNTNLIGSQEHMANANTNLIGSQEHMANANPNLIGSRQHGAQANLSGWVATRANFRPFTLAEQKRILRVGACLTCHDENSDIMFKSLEADFEEYLKGVSKECILPF